MVLKKQIFLCFLILISSFCYSQVKTEYKIFKTNSGLITSEGTLKDGKPNGYWKTYHLNGKLKTEGNRVNYNLDGIWRFYDINGYLTTEINYKDGLKNGEWISYNEKGEKKISYVYKRGIEIKRDGIKIRK